MVSFEVPEDIAKVLAPLLGHLAEFETAGRDGQCVDFAAGERSFMAHVAALEGQGLARMLKALDPAARRVEVDGKTYRRMNNPNSEATYFSLRSSIRVDRALYRLEGDRNGPTLVPMELRAGIVEGVLTPAAAHGIGALGSAMPSREAAQMSTRLGVLPYSRSEHFRAAVQLGKKWGELRELQEGRLMQDMVLPPEVVAASVSVDRASVPMAEPRPVTDKDRAKGVKRPISVNLRMAFCAVLTLYDQVGEPLECVRYAHVPTGGAAAMRKVLRRDLDILRSRIPGIRVVALADGAADMQSILEDVTAGHPVAARLVDFWHLLEKLAAGCTAANEDASTHLIRFRELLLEDDDAVEKIGSDLASWATRFPDRMDASGNAVSQVPEDLHAAITYTTNNADQMRYASVKAAGLPIGSGTVEATAKTIIGTRMRRPGARWVEHGAQPILDLRSLATSSGRRWNGAMHQILTSYRKHVSMLPAA